MADHGLERRLASHVGGAPRGWRPPPSPAELVAAARRHGWRPFHLDLHGAASPGELDAAARAAFALPAWAGPGLDALADLLRDLSWAPAERWLVVVSGAGSLVAADPARWAGLVDVLAGAAATWAGDGRAFATFVASPVDLPGVPPVG